MAYTAIPGVYMIHCSGNKKVYVGSSVSVKQRIATHFSQLKRGVHGNKHLQNAFNRFGEASFFPSIIAECEESDRIELEQHWINHYNAADPEYGMNNSWTAVTTVGFKHSDATKRLLSEQKKGVYQAHLKAANDKRIGKPGHSLGKPGKAWTSEMKSKASISHAGQKAWNKGIPQTEETKQKISASASVATVRYGSEYVKKANELRSNDKTMMEIAKELCISVSTVSRMLGGFRTFEKIKGKP